MKFRYVENVDRDRVFSLGGEIFRYRPISDGNEKSTWNATVGLLERPMKRALLGQSGMLRYFDVQFLGERREAIVTPNSSFPGKWKLRRSANG
jgi:hypothetical protein